MAVAGCADGDKDASAGETTAASSGGASSGAPTTTAATETGETGPAAMVTWHQDIAPIVAQK